MEEVVNVIRYIDGGGDPPEDSTEEKSSDWEKDDTAIPYIQRCRRYSSDDDVVYNVNDTE